MVVSKIFKMVMRDGSGVQDVDVFQFWKVFEF